MRAFLTENNKVVQLAAYQAAAATDFVCATLDMLDYDGVVILASVGTAATSVGLKAGAGNQANGSDAADLAGSKTLSDGTLTRVVLDILRPNGTRYLTPTVVRGASTAIDAVWAVLYNPRKAPTVNATTAQTVKRMLTPSFGTA